MTSKERFLKYIAVSTASSEESEKSPSTARQLDLAAMLKGEMEELINALQERQQTAAAT